MKTVLTDVYGDVIHLDTSVYWVHKAGKSKAETPAYIDNTMVDILRPGEWWLFKTKEDMEQFINNDYEIVTLEF